MQHSLHKVLCMNRLHLEKFQNSPLEVPSMWLSIIKLVSPLIQLTEEDLSTAVISLRHLIPQLFMSTLMIQKLSTEYANSQLNTDNDSTRIFSLILLVIVDMDITSLMNLNSLSLICMRRFAKFKKLALKFTMPSLSLKVSLKTVLTRESEIRLLPFVIKNSLRFQLLRKQLNNTNQMVTMEHLLSEETGKIWISVCLEEKLNQLDSVHSS